MANRARHFAIRHSPFAVSEGPQEPKRITNESRHHRCRQCRWNTWHRLGAEGRARDFLRRAQSAIRKGASTCALARRQGAGRHGCGSGGVCRRHRAGDAVERRRSHDPLPGRRERQDHPRRHQSVGDGAGRPRARDRPRHLSRREGAGLGEGRLGPRRSTRPATATWPTR